MNSYEHKKNSPKQGYFLFNMTFYFNIHLWLITHLK